MVEFLKAPDSSTEVLEIAAAAIRNLCGGSVENSEVCLSVKNMFLSHSAPSVIPFLALSLSHACARRISRCGCWTRLCKSWARNGRVRAWISLPLYIGISGNRPGANC